MKRTWALLFGVCAAIGLCALPASGAMGDLLIRFVSPDASAEDCFGSSIAVSGDHLLISAEWADQGGVATGAAYLFDGTTGACLQTYANPSPDHGDVFGRSVALVGDKVIVSATLDDNVGGSDAGAVHVFDRDTAALLHTYYGKGDGDELGSRLAVFGDDILVGSHRTEVTVDGSEVDAGVAYLFDGAMLSDQPILEFNSPNPSSGGAFGSHMVAVGSNVAITAALEDIGAEDAGVTYLFDGSSGSLVRTIPNPMPDVYDVFGADVDSGAGGILVGVRFDDEGATDTWAAHWFNSDGDFLRTLTNPRPVVEAQFGLDVAVVGVHALVGAPNDDALGTNVGAAHLFDDLGGLVWTFENPTPVPHDQFGHVVVAYGNNVLVGALSENNEYGETAGAVYLFEAVPEPATLSLLAVGVGLLFRRRSCRSGEGEAAGRRRLAGK